jgi:hypothetical protein
MMPMLQHFGVGSIPWSPLGGGCEWAMRVGHASGPCEWAMRVVEE